MIVYEQSIVRANPRNGCADSFKLSYRVVHKCRVQRADLAVDLDESVVAFWMEAGFGVGF